MQLTTQPIDTFTVITFEKVNEIKLIYAALQTNDGTFEIGQIGYEGADNYSVNKIEAFGHSFIKVTGAVGANAPIVNYVSLISPPTSIHIEAHTIEADVDQDGINEIVASS